MRPLLGLFVLLAAVPAAHAQSPADALRGTARTITAKELPDGFRPVALGSGEGGLGSLYAFAGMSAAGDGAEATRSSMLFSLMGVTFVDPDEFAALLDGKRARIRGYALDLGALIRGSKAGARSTPFPVFAETWIEAGRIAQWSPKPALSKAAILTAFDPTNPQAQGGDSLSKVKQLATGFLLYASDYDDHFPKADSTAGAKAVVMPYVKNESLWTTANGRVLYNTALSNVADTSLESPPAVLLVWEERPAPDGMRAVGFADGHAKRVSEAEWETLWAAELVRRKRR